MSSTSNSEPSAGGAAGRSRPARDQLLAQINLSKRRLGRFAEGLAGRAETDRARFAPQIAAVADRADQLAQRVTSWHEVEIGIATAVEDLSASVDTLEADAAAAFGPESYDTALDRQVRWWRGRLDRLRLQGTLAAMEADDDFERLTHRLEQARAVALVELERATGDSSAVVVDLRRDVENVLGDVRRAVNRASAALTGC